MTNEDLVDQLEQVAKFTADGRPRDETNLDPELLHTLGYIYATAKLAVLKYREKPK